MSEPAIIVDTPPPAPAPTDDKVTLTKDELEALVTSRVGRAVEAASRKKAPDPEVDAMRKRIEEFDRKALEEKGQYEAAKQSIADSVKKEYEPKLAASDQRAKTLHEKLEAKVIGQSVSDAAGAFNAVNPAAVRTLLAGDFKMNDSYEAIVVDEQGNQRFVAGKPMTPEQRVKEYLDANPWLVRSTAGAGGGAGGGRSVVTGDTNAVSVLEAKVKALADEATATGSTRVLVAHSAALKELAKLKAGAA